MAKFQLTISADYVPSWGLPEGLREAVQNALDGAQAGFPVEIEPPTSSSKTLRITNKGVTLDRSIWLMGTTSKSSGNYRGCYGEGLKLGALALVRAGRTVTFSNGAEDWRVKLESSATFSGKSVVTVYTVKRRQPSDDFTVSITCLPDEWEKAKLQFLDLLSDPPNTYTQPSGDQVILDSAFAGKLFVKGILVEEQEGMALGYNFASASVDRDRKMVSAFDRDWYISATLSRAAAESGSGFNPDDLLSLLLEGGKDAQAFKMRQPFQQALGLVEDAWIRRFGEGTVPVSSTEEMNAAGHIGLKGVFASEPVCAFFVSSKRLGLEILSRSRIARPTQTWEIEQLSHFERIHMESAIELVDAAVRHTRVGVSEVAGRISIVTFSSPQVLGQHDASVCPARILLSRTVLGEFVKTLEVLIHEAAHDAGGDGDAHHQRAEGALYSRIVLNVLQGHHSCPRHLHPATLALPLV